MQFGGLHHIWIMIFRKVHKLLDCPWASVVDGLAVTRDVQESGVPPDGEVVAELFVFITKFKNIIPIHNANMNNFFKFDFYVFSVGHARFLCVSGHVFPEFVLEALEGWLGSFAMSAPRSIKHDEPFMEQGRGGFSELLVREVKKSWEGFVSDFVNSSN